MSNPSVLGQIAYELESTFAEDITTFATADLRPCIPVDTSGLKHNKVDSMRTQPYRNQGSQWILGIQEGSFKTKHYMTGHGSTTAGSVTAGIIETLMGYVFGNVTAGADGTTFTGGTASVPLTTSSGTFAAGSLVRAGALGDARGNGQFAAVSTHSTTSLNLLTALPAGPNNADVCYTSVMYYPSSSPTSVSMSGLRFLLQTANVQYECHGCVATDIALGSFKAGMIPYIEITWTVSWWRYSTATFPNTASTETFQPAPIAAGSIFVNTVGTATRATRTARDLTITYKPGVVMLPGHGGASPYQQYVGAVRTQDQINVSWTEDADAATTTPVLPGYGTATNAKHILASLSTTNGSALGIYLRNVAITNVPTQVNDGGINRFKITGRAYTSSTTTSALTLAPIVFASA